MRIIEDGEFDAYWQERPAKAGDAELDAAVLGVIAAVRKEGDRAVRRFASQFDRSSPEKPELPAAALRAAWERLETAEPDLAEALELAADHILRFARRQKAQIVDFEYEMGEGLITGQRVIPVQRAAVYVPAGRFPLISSVLMGVLPAAAAGVEEVLVVSPPLEDGLPDRRILAAAFLAGRVGSLPPPALRVFALGGAQAIAALALGTETVPRVDLIAGPGNKYVAAAKRLLYGEVGIDFVAGPTDVLIISDGKAGDAPGRDGADLAAADMLAQAEHDGDARARALVPSRDLADRIAAALEKRLAALPTASTARASLDAGGLIIIYHTPAEAVRIANTIAPEHLELQAADAERWVPALKNYGSLFIGTMAAEVLGDYSAGINHTLPTSASARFTGGLSVRHFLKTPTTLRCTGGEAYVRARLAAERIARAEGLMGHAASAESRG
ncbi:MAG: histidinol dehydrogenase [Treponema sp.]|jgi:histidinol dehydrogenase|nr:histidinol dehydrogenase [Treponema sp.]